MLIAQVVLPMIDEGNYVIQQHVASILADLATTEGDVAQFLRETGPKLCQLVQSHNFQVAQQAVRALTNFALHSILDRESIRQSISSGKLTCFLNEGNPAVKVTAAHCIEVIAEQVSFLFVKAAQVGLLGCFTLQAKCALHTLVAIRFLPQRFKLWLVNRLSE